jgi:hypothetical protein
MARFGAKWRSRAAELGGSGGLGPRDLPSRPLARSHDIVPGPSGELDQLVRDPRLRAGPPSRFVRRRASDRGLSSVNPGYRDSQMSQLWLGHPFAPLTAFKSHKRRVPITQQTHSDTERYKRRRFLTGSRVESSANLGFFSSGSPLLLSISTYIERRRTTTSPSQRGDDVVAAVEVKDQQKIERLLELESLAPTNSNPNYERSY